MKNNPFSLIGKNIIITGASSGIGKQCAIACSRSGASIALFGRDVSRLKETRKLMNDPKKHLYCSLDLLEYDEIGNSVKYVINRLGKLDGLINCAGISTTLPINTISPKNLEHFFQTNVSGSVILTKNVVKSAHFSSTGGSIVFLSSVMGVVGESGKTLYSISKGAVIAAVKSLAIELARRKIRVNAISPGVVESPMSISAVYSKDKKTMDRIMQLHPLGLGQPDDIANSCVFLLSDASRWITGTNLIVDGGYLAK